jgi:uncharacterized damage-inducible protein DinB
MDVSNPSGTAGDHAERYVDDLLELLGARDPVEVQAGLLDALRDATEGLSSDELRRPEAPGKWSVMDVVRHLADTELVYRYRMRMTVAQPGSPIPAYDQDKWAEALRYRSDDLDAALGELEALRRANLTWIEGLSEDELARQGLHEERGPESVGRIVEFLAAHDLVHRRQIDRIKGAVL